MADSRPVQVDQTTDRAAAFARLATTISIPPIGWRGAILRDPGEAQDATHDALLQALRKWATLRCCVAHATPLGLS